MQKIPADFKRIIVRTPTWVGDAVMSLPALEALRNLFPDAAITLAAPPATAEVFLDTAVANQILVQKTSDVLSVFRNAREWRRGKFDLVILLQNAFAAAATARLAGIPARVGYHTDRRGSLLTTAIPLPSWKDERHESLYYLNIVSEFERTAFGTSLVNDTEPQFALDVSEERKQAARAMLIHAGAADSKPLAILCPGSVNSRAKRWPAERFAELADRIIDSGTTVVLIGSPGEIDVTNEVLAQAKRKPIALTGQTTVAEAFAIISVADVLVTNDTGPAHIGAAVRTPTLVIFGPTNPLTTYPLSPKAEIVREPPECAPCMLRDCPIDHRCMTAITPEQIFQRAIALMDARAVQQTG